MNIQPEKVLSEYWGFEQFRDPQGEVIQNILNARDTFVLMPTGGGKSICFQVPGLILEGISIVISPLISLIKDQVFQLKKRNILVESIYSGMSIQDVDRILENCALGKIKFLYISPERIKNSLFIARLQRMKVAQIVVDEAHCISQWGYDFRPAYLDIATIRELVPHAPMVALTATATPQVVSDIIEHLKLKEPEVFKKSFLRTNIVIGIKPSKNKHQDLVSFLNKVDGSGIIYARNRKTTVDFSLFLKDLKFNVTPFHAGMSVEMRSELQNDWIKNKTKIMLATTAFGMGIDKPDVRFVAHITSPSSIEEFYQEIGRAGRDGLKSFAILYYDELDIERLNKSSQDLYPNIEEVKRIYKSITFHYQIAKGIQNFEFYDLIIEEFSKKYNHSSILVTNSLKILAQNNIISLTDSFFAQPSVQFLLNQDELRTFQLNQTKYKAVINALLRLFGGIMNLPTEVKLGHIASFLKINSNAVNQLLFELDRQGVIDYKPQNGLPKISFNNYRYEAENLPLDMSKIEFLKKRHLERIQSINELILTTECRNKKILNYFGENLENACEACDNCVLKKKKKINTTIEDEILKKVLSLIPSNGIRAHQLKDECFATLGSIPFEKILNLLILENYIVIEDLKIKHCEKR